MKITTLFCLVSFVSLATAASIQPVVGELANKTHSNFGFNSTKEKESGVKELAEELLKVNIQLSSDTVQSNPKVFHTTDQLFKNSAVQGLSQISNHADLISQSKSRGKEQTNVSFPGVATYLPQDDLNVTESPSITFMEMANHTGSNPTRNNSAAKILFEDVFKLGNNLTSFRSNDTNGQLIKDSVGEVAEIASKEISNSTYHRLQNDATASSPRIVISQTSHLSKNDMIKPETFNAKSIKVREHTDHPKGELGQRELTSPVVEGLVDHLQSITNNESITENVKEVINDTSDQNYQSSKYKEVAEVKELISPKLETNDHDSNFARNSTLQKLANINLATSVITKVINHTDSILLDISLAKEFVAGAIKDQTSNATTTNTSSKEVESILNIEKDDHRRLQNESSDKVVKKLENSTNWVSTKFGAETLKNLNNTDHPVQSSSIENGIKTIPIKKMDNTGNISEITSNKEHLIASKFTKINSHPTNSKNSDAQNISANKEAKYTTGTDRALAKESITGKMTNYTSAIYSATFADNDFKNLTVSERIKHLANVTVIITTGPSDKIHSKGINNATGTPIQANIIDGDSKERNQTDGTYLNKENGSIPVFQNGSVLTLLKNESMKKESKSLEDEVSVAEKSVAETPSQNMNATMNSFQDSSMKNVMESQNRINETELADKDQTFPTTVVLTNQNNLQNESLLVKNVSYAKALPLPNSQPMFPQKETLTDEVSEMRKNLSTNFRAVNISNVESQNNGWGNTFDVNTLPSTKKPEVHLNDSNIEFQRSQLVSKMASNGNETFLHAHCPLLVPPYPTHTIEISFSVLVSDLDPAELPKLFEMALRKAMNDSRCSSVVRKGFHDDHPFIYRWANLSENLNTCNQPDIVKDRIMEDSRLSENFTQAFLPEFQIEHVTFHNLPTCFFKTKQFSVLGTVLIALCCICCLPFIICLAVKCFRSRANNRGNLLKARSPFVMSTDLSNASQKLNHNYSSTSSFFNEGYDDKA